MAEWRNPVYPAADFGPCRTSACASLWMQSADLCCSSCHYRPQAYGPGAGESMLVTGNNLKTDHVWSCKLTDSHLYARCGAICSGLDTFESLQAVIDSGARELPAIDLVLAHWVISLRRQRGLVNQRFAAPWGRLPPPVIDRRTMMTALMKRSGQAHRD